MYGIYNTYKIYRSRVRIFFMGLFSALLFFSFPASVPAQSLPQRPVSPKIRTGILDSGIKYYVVTNTTEKDKVDMALVQKVGLNDESEQYRGLTIVQSKASITDIPHFKDGTPLSFMTDNGIWPSEDGYVKVSDDCTTFRFKEIDLLLKPAAVDSTLLMMFDIIEQQAPHLGDLYSPQNQAIIVSGDVDPATVLGKMYMLSMLVRRQKATLPERTVSTGLPFPARLVVRPQPSPKTAAITVDYAIDRIPPENMNTVQPLVTEKFVRELFIILKQRIRRSLRSEHIPVATVDLDYIPSSETPGPEHLSLRIITTPDKITEATKIVARTLAQFDMTGAGAAEYKDAVEENITALKSASLGDNVPNRDYVEMCKSNFLYGSSLAAPSSDLEFFTKRNVDDDLSLKLFNDFAQATIDRSRNLTLTAEAPRSIATTLLRVFDSEWTGTGMSGETFIPDDRDTVALTKKNIPKVKVAIDNPEPLSGGKMWTFSNGVKVIYKQAPAGNEGLFHYTWLFKSGYSWIPNLTKGEGAYISDMLWQSDFSSLSSNAFTNILTANGIKMDAKVSVSDFQLTGYAPSDKMDLLLKALLSIANERQVSKTSYETYRRNEALRRDLAVGGKEYRLATLDSIMAPTSAFSTYKKPLDLSDDFKERCDILFERVFSKANDGVLIIVGNFNEEALKKTLCNYIGGFRTEKVATMRTKTQRSTIYGKMNEYAVGDEPSLDIMMSIPIAYTVDNFLTTRVAAYLLEDAIGREAASLGWRVDSDWHQEMFPEERFFFRTQLDPANSSGLPASIFREENVDRVMEKINAAMADLAKKGVDKKTFDSAKKMLGHSVAAWNSTPENIIDFLLLRYSYGKDLMTDQASKLNSVTLEGTNAVIRNLVNGSVGEYAVRKRRTGEVLASTDPVKETIPVVEPMYTAVKDNSGNGALYWSIFEGHGELYQGKPYWNAREILRYNPVRTMPIALPLAAEFRTEDPGKVIVDEREEEEKLKAQETEKVAEETATEGEGEGEVVEQEQQKEQEGEGKEEQEQEKEKEQ